MRKLVYMIVFVTRLHANVAPHLVETKVQADLEGALARLMPPEQFLVQVNADVQFISERRVVEGETYAFSPDPPEIVVAPMPGFVPEAEVKPPKQAPQTRQIYRLVETPTLKGVRVSVKFDDIANATAVVRAKSLVAEYLKTNYPTTGTAIFSVVSMFKKELPKLPPEEPKKTKEPPKPLLEPWQWGVLALLVIVGMVLLKNAFTPTATATAPKTAARRPLTPSYAGMPNVPWPPGWGMPPGAAVGKESDEQGQAASLRRTILEKFIGRAEIFRQYWNVLNLSYREELLAVLRGPAFENFLQGIRVEVPKNVDIDPSDPIEVLEYHRKNFAEFVQARDWSEKQFFGFLQTLTDQQLLALAHHESPLTVGVMLRFMTATQSARLLESLPLDRRRAILSQAKEAQSTPFSELLNIEREVRATVQRMPTNLYANRKQEVEFWGNLVSEAEDQQSILEDLEKTNPEIYPNLKKFKFSLDDAATLTNSIIEKILVEVDNEELCLALATCKEDVVEVLLDGVSPKRRQIVMAQLASYRSAAPADKSRSRNSLTKKFREVLQ